LAGKGLKAGKEGHTLGGIAMSLFDATDFADRLKFQPLGVGNGPAPQGLLEPLLIAA